MFHDKIEVTHSRGDLTMYKTDAVPAQKKIILSVVMIEDELHKICWHRQHFVHPSVMTARKSKTLLHRNHESFNQLIEVVILPSPQTYRYLSGAAATSATERWWARPGPCGARRQLAS